MKFAMQDIHKKKRLKDRWRKARGLQSKMRLKKKGYRIKVMSGFQTKASERGKHKSGLKINNVSTIKELESIDPKKDLIIIAANVGTRKRLIIAEAAQKKNIKILNVNPEELKKKIDAKLDNRKKLKQTRKQKVEKRKVEKKDTIDKAVEETEEEQKDKEKKEKDKLLTKKV